MSSVALSNCINNSSKQNMSQLPRDVWLHIASFLSPEDTGSLAQTCRYADKSFSDRRELSLRGNLIFDRLMRESDLYRRAPRKIGFLQNLLSRCFPITRALSINDTNARVHALRGLFPTRNAPLPAPNPPHPSHTPVEQRMSRANPPLSRSGDELWIWGLLNGDESLCRSLSPELFSIDTLHAGAFISLLRNDLDSLRHILRSYPSLKNSQYITPFLLEAAAANQIDLFQELFLSAHQISTNYILVALVQSNHRQAISCLLQLADANVDREGYPDTGFNRPEGANPGLHTALLRAFDLNHEEAAGLLLNAFPGQQIPLPIFRSIYALYRFTSLQLPQIPGDLMWNAHAIRTQHPNINRVLQQIEQEAAARYPGQALAPPQIEVVEAPEQAAQVQGGVAAEEVEEPIQQLAPPVLPLPNPQSSVDAFFMSIALIYALGLAISPEDSGPSIFLGATLCIGLFLLDRLFS